MLATHALPALPGFPSLLLLSLPALLPWIGRGFWAGATLGVLLTVWQAEHRLVERWPAARHGEDVEVSGRIASLPEISEAGEGEDSRTWRFAFEPEPASAAEMALPSRIRVSWYRSEELLRGGDCWRFRLRLRTPHGSMNPGGFDYEAWLWRAGIGATATVRDAQRCETSGGFSMLRLRQRLVERYAEWLPGHPALPLVAALTVGDASGLSDSDWDAFRLTGTSHLVAISGFNVAIVAGIAFFILRWLWTLWPRACLWLPAQRAGLIGSALTGLLYAVLAGWDAPVERAALMLLAFVTAAWFHRLAQPSRLLALAWLALLVADPSTILSPGLWLSFGAVAAIFYVSAGRLTQRPAWLAAIHVQLMLSAALAPLTLYFFHGLAWLAPLVNLVAVPVAAVLTPALLLAIFLAWALPGLGLPLLGLCADALEFSRQGLVWLAHWAPQTWTPASPSAGTLLLALAGLVMLFAPRGLPLKPLALLCLLPLLFPGVQAPAKDYRVTVLDVGQGLAVVVQTAGHTLLYDAGPAFEDGFDAGESVVVPFLLQQGLRRLDLLLLSHGDRDHAGGVAAVRRLMPISREIGTDRGEACRQGENWDWDGVHFELLHPGEDTWSDNDSSCVLRIGGRYVSLLPGDIEAAAEQSLVSRFGDALRADLLIAPHHGSKTSSTEGFLQAVHPALVVYGAGWRNHFGHPRPEVVDRYRGLHVRQFTSGVGGAITVGDERGSLEASEYRLQGRHFWNAPAEP